MGILFTKLLLFGNEMQKELYDFHSSSLLLQECSLESYQQLIQLCLFPQSESSLLHSLVCSIAGTEISKCEWTGSKFNFNLLEKISTSDSSSLIEVIADMRREKKKTPEIIQAAAKLLCYPDWSVRNHITCLFATMEPNQLIHQWKDILFISGQTHSLPSDKKQQNIVEEIEQMMEDLHIEEYIVCETTEQMIENAEKILLHSVVNGKTNEIKFKSALSLLKLRGKELHKEWKDKVVEALGLLQGDEVWWVDSEEEWNDYFRKEVAVLLRELIGVNHPIVFQLLLKLMNDGYEDIKIEAARTLTLLTHPLK